MTDDVDNKRNFTRIIAGMKASRDLTKEKKHRQKVRYRENGESEFDYAWELHADKIQLIAEHAKIEAINNYEFQEHKQADLLAIDSDIKFIDAYIFELSNDGLHPATQPKSKQRNPRWHDAILKDIIIPFYQANNRKPRLAEAIVIIKKLADDDHPIFFSVGRDHIRGNCNFAFSGIKGDITQKAVENILSSQWKAFQKSL